MKKKPAAANFEKLSLQATNTYNLDAVRAYVFWCSGACSEKG